MQIGFARGAERSPARLQRAMIDGADLVAGQKGAAFADFTDQAPNQARP